MTSAPLDPRVPSQEPSRAEHFGWKRNFRADDARDLVVLHELELANADEKKPGTGSPALDDDLARRGAAS